MSFTSNYNLHYLGNKAILKKYKTAFFCSRKCPADIILKTLDWAREQKEKKRCIISGFHSKIEIDVFDILIKGEQPLILVLARGMKKRWSQKIKKAIENEKLLIISPFEENIKYITQETANNRNEIMADLANEVFIAYYITNGNLHQLIKALENQNSEKLFFINKRQNRLNST